VHSLGNGNGKSHLMSESKFMHGWGSPHRWWTNEARFCGYPWDASMVWTLGTYSGKAKGGWKCYNTWSVDEDYENEKLQTCVSITCDMSCSCQCLGNLWGPRGKERLPDRKPTVTVKLNTYHYLPTSITKTSTSAWKHNYLVIVSEVRYWYEDVVNWNNTSSTTPKSMAADSI
jgi:hypothetical protein